MAITLKGWVYNDDGTPANNLTVTCYDQVPNVIGTTSTDATGLWQFTSLSAGVTYDVKINNNNSIIRWIKGGEMHQVADLNLTGAQTLTALWDFTSGSLALPTQAAVVTQGRIGLTAAGGSVWFGDGTVSRTVATLDQTQTLTNKTLTSPTITGATINGLGSAVTGSGSLVGAASPSIASPTITGTLTNSGTISGGTISGIASGPYTNDWFRNNLSGTGWLNQAQGIGLYIIDAVAPRFYGGSYSGTYLVSDTGTQTLTNKTLANPLVTNGRMQGNSGYVTTSGDLTNYVFNYGTGTFTLPTPSATYSGVFRGVKAWGGGVTVNCAVAQIAAPGGTAMVSSFTINNGDSVTLWCDGTYWWSL